MITEEFSVIDDSRINGVYISVGEVSKDSGSTITVALSQNGSELYAEETDASKLSEYSENYMPFVLPARASGKLSVTLNFNATNSSDYITIPKTGMGHSSSYLFALNSSRPSMEIPPVSTED